MNIFERFWNRVNDEPVATQYVIQTAVALAIGFGLNWTAQQETLVLVFTGSILTWLTRKAVTPVKE